MFRALNFLISGVSVRVAKPSQLPNISIKRADKGKLITVFGYEGTHFHMVMFDSITACHFFSLHDPALILSVQKLLSLLSVEMRIQHRIKYF